MDHLDATGTTDADLAKAWAAGNERGFDAIVARYLPMVYSRCRRALGAADADDATQAVFLVLARKRDQAIASPALAAWLQRVAENVLRHAWRDRERRRRAERAAPQPAPTREETDMADIKDHLDACLAQLPSVEREAVQLHHLAGHSLAEVAQHTGSGLSTVKERNNRGLERLKKLLTARGVALSVPFLIAGLGSEAQAAVPAEVVSHVRDLISADGRAGATGAPSERAIRWSRPRTSIMTKITIAGVCLLLAGGAAVHFLGSAEAGSSATTAASAATPPITKKQEKATASAGIFDDIDPEHAHEWGFIRANDGARLARRLRTVPEFAIIPPEMAPWVEAVGSVRNAAIVEDLHSGAAPEFTRGYYILHHELAKLPAAEQAARTRTETRKFINNIMAHVKNGDLPPKPATKVWNGWLDSTTADAAVLGLLRDKLADTDVFAVNPDGKSWSGSVDVGEVQVAITGARMDIRSQGAMTPLTAAVQSAVDRSSDADLEIGILLDPGKPKAELRRMFTANMRLTDDGLRFTAGGEFPGMEGDFAKAEGVTPHIDRQRFDAIPASAVLAASMAMRPSSTRDSMFWQRILAPLENPDAPPQLKALMEAPLTILNQIDGELVCWLEPGSPYPMFTMEADLSQAAAENLIVATGMPRAADGSVSNLTGPVPFSCGWREGKLVLTTNPAGLAGVNHSGGFTNHEEIKRALAMMPDVKMNACVLLRPAAMTKMAMPFAAMFAPGLQDRLLDYEKRLTEGKAYSYLQIGTDAKGMKIDATGMLALACGGALVSAAKSPSPLMKVAN